MRRSPRKQFPLPGVTRAMPWSKAQDVAQPGKGTGAHRRTTGHLILKQPLQELGPQSRQ